ncbi:MAG: ABC transporter permease [Phycisphaerae bacterium]
MQLWAVIVDSLRESIDRKIFWLLLVLTAFVVIVIASIGFEHDRVTLLFGMFDVASDRYNPALELGRSRIAGLLVHGFLSVVLGWIGVLLAVIATAGVFPSMLGGGAISVLLAKPISRPRLFLYKYIASMVFIFVQATAFVVGTFLAVGTRWGVWVPGYLVAIPLVVLLFSYIYCISVLVAVKTRSTVASILISVGAWVAFALIHQAPQVFEWQPDWKANTTVYRAVKIVGSIPPKTGDLPYLAARWASASTSVDAMPQAMMGPGVDINAAQLAAADRYERDLINRHPIYSIGSSVLFEMVVLVWAMVSFMRQDY